MHCRKVKNGIKTVEFMPLPIQSFQFINLDDNQTAVYAYFPIDETAEPTFHRLGTIIKEETGYTKQTATCRGYYNHAVETFAEAVEDFRYSDYAYSAKNWKRLDK